MVSALLGVACAPTAGTRPDDMSAERHRAHAEAERRKALAHEKQYDPDAVAEATLPLGSKYDVVTYNPTAPHADEAKKHRAHAEAHRAAARELEEFEEAECKLFPPETRKVCPLLGAVEAVREIDGGVSLQLAASFQRDAVLAHVRCHLAFARTQGHTGMDDCPLYLAGVRAEAGVVEHALDLSAGNAAQLPELRKRLLDHVAP